VIFALAALLFASPTFLGERYGWVGVGFSIAASLLVLVADGARARLSKSSTAVVLFLVLAMTWQLLRASDVRADEGLLFQTACTMTVILVAFGCVVANRSRAVAIARAFVWSVLLICASAVVTSVGWILLGVGQLAMSTFPVGLFTATIHFPFTVTVEVQHLFGIAVPRFSGFGREPGWMSMFAATAWFLWPQVGRPTRCGRLLLIVGVLAPLSTAGFGIFLVVLVGQWLLVPRRSSAAAAVIRFGSGLAAMAGAIWVAVSAPVFGLEAKSSINAQSLDARTAVTEAGWDALLNLSLGEQVSASDGRLNLIAAVANFGWPYAVLILCALLAPLMRHPRRRAALLPVGVVTLFLLLAQPPGGSVVAFALVMLAYAIASAQTDTSLVETNPERDARSTRSHAFAKT
jgi:hypothetical protein